MNLDKTRRNEEAVARQAKRDAMIKASTVMVVIATLLSAFWGLLALWGAYDYFFNDVPGTGVHTSNGVLALLLMAFTSVALLWVTIDLRRKP